MKKVDDESILLEEVPTSNCGRENGGRGRYSAIRGQASDLRRLAATSPPPHILQGEDVSCPLVLPPHFSGDLLGFSELLKPSFGDLFNGSNWVLGFSEWLRLPSEICFTGHTAFWNLMNGSNLPSGIYLSLKLPWEISEWL